MRISDWSSDVCSSDLAVGAHLPAHDRFEMIDRVIRQDIERTAGRIAAEESALRATQDLQALKVIEVGEALRRTSDVNAIDIGSHGRIIGEDRLKITLSRSEEHTSELQSLMRISYA